MWEIFNASQGNNLKRHRMVSLKRASKGAFSSEDESGSNSSRVPDDGTVPADRQDSIRVPPVHIPPAPIRNRQRRYANMHLSKNFPCDICNRPHGNMSEFNEHRNVHFMPINDLPTTMSNDFASLILAKHAFGGHACENDLVSHEACSDALHFFQISAGLVKDLIRTLSPTYLLQGRMVARARFFQLNDAGERVGETFLFFPSNAQSFIDSDGEEWYGAHANRIIQHLDVVLHQSSNLEFDCIERVYVKLILRDNANGHGVFILPPKLAKKRQAIVNVDATGECLKYALLSILHYDDVSNHQRCNVTSYREWEGELKFGDLDVNNIRITDIPTVERLNQLKINIHV